jgi:uncharacterized protein with HEPN domain
MLNRQTTHQAAYLHDMLESAQSVRAYTEGMTLEQFWESPTTRDAVVMRLVMIGEVSGKIDARTAAMLPKIPFAEISGLRNRIAHAYDKVDFKEVWNVVQQNMSPLIVELSTHLLVEGQRLEQGLKKSLLAARPSQIHDALKASPRAESSSMPRHSRRNSV